MPEDTKTPWLTPDHRKSQRSTNKTATIKYYNKYSNTIESDKKAKAIKSPSHLPVEAPGLGCLSQSPRPSPRGAASPSPRGPCTPHSAAGCCLGRAYAPRNVLLMQSKAKTTKIVKHGTIYERPKSPRRRTSKAPSKAENVRNSNPFITFKNSSYSCLSRNDVEWCRIVENACLHAYCVAASPITFS